MLKSGGAMNFVYESALMTTNVVLNLDFTTQVLRNLARVKPLMITFSTNAGDDRISQEATRCTCRPTR